MGETVAAAWITFHHKGVIAERGQFLALLRRFRDRLAARVARLMSLLQPQGATLEERVAAGLIYPPGYESATAPFIGRKSIDEHLSVLLERGSAVEEGGRYRVA